MIAVDVLVVVVVLSHFYNSTRDERARESDRRWPSINLNASDLAIWRQSYAKPPISTPALG